MQQERSLKAAKE
jgi:hypothetical protein